MDKIFTVAQVVAPIFSAILLGILARRNSWLTAVEVQGFQKFVMQIGLPCVLFGSCLKADIGAESLSGMALLLVILLSIQFAAFRLKRKRISHHNLPMLMGAKESGMLGIPLYMVLFGANEAYRLGVLDMTQVMIVCPVIAILSADTGENPTVSQLAKKALATPLMILSLLGLLLNLTGLGRALDTVGIGGVIDAAASFLAQPVSALMIFSVGYNFSMSRGSAGKVLKYSAIHLGLFALVCALMQLILCLIPGVDALTRWAVVLYCAMPPSYLAPGLGRSEEDFTLASGVCSILTVVCLVIFCVIAGIVA